MNEEIEKLLVLISEINARAEAAESLLAACTMVVKDDPRFQEALVTVHNSRMAGSLNNGASDAFISAFEDHLVALTPLDIRHLLQ